MNPSPRSDARARSSRASPPTAPPDADRAAVPGVDVARSRRAPRRGPALLGRQHRAPPTPTSPTSRAVIPTTPRTRARPTPSSPPGCGEHRRAASPRSRPPRRRAVLDVVGRAARPRARSRATRCRRRRSTGGTPRRRRDAGPARPPTRRPTRSTSSSPSVIGDALDALQGSVTSRRATPTRTGRSGAYGGPGRRHRRDRVGSPARAVPAHRPRLRSRSRATPSSRRCSSVSRTPSDELRPSVARPVARATSERTRAIPGEGAAPLSEPVA